MLDGRFLSTFVCSSWEALEQLSPLSSLPLNSSKLKILFSRSISLNNMCVCKNPTEKKRGKKARLKLYNKLSCWTLVPCSTCVVSFLSFFVWVFSENSHNGSTIFELGSKMKPQVAAGKWVKIMYRIGFFPHMILSQLWRTVCTQGTLVLWLKIVHDVLSATRAKWSNPKLSVSSYRLFWLGEKCTTPSLDTINSLLNRCYLKLMLYLHVF